MYAGSKYEPHYTVWTAWISIRVRVGVRVYFILQNLAPPGTTVHVPTAGRREGRGLYWSSAQSIPAGTIRHFHRTAGDGGVQRLLPASVSDLGKEKKGKIVSQQSFSELQQTR